MKPTQTPATLENAEHVFTFPPPYMSGMPDHPGLYRTEDGDWLWVDAFNPDRATTPRRVTVSEALNLLSGRMVEEAAMNWEAHAFADLLRGAAALHEERQHKETEV